MKQHLIRTVFPLFMVIFLLHAAPAMGEMGTTLPVIGEGEGFLKAGKTASTSAPVVTSAKTMGEMGAALPVIGKGEGFLKAGKSAPASAPVITSAKNVVK